MAYTFKHGDRPLDGVTVQRAVGRGGFGEVYYALTDSGKQLALKYLRDNPEIELRGIAHVMNLKSPYLITVYDVRRNTQGEPFVLMEYVAGPSLRDLMTAETGGFGLQKAAFFLKGIAQGLSYLHERGIVHRDLKPANIFYDDGYVKIGDYGLSKHISVSQHSGQTVSVGTVHYMAPEIGSGNYTKAIDIYALGVILFEMLTGRLPFSGASMGEILMRHLRDQPDLHGVPQPFVPVILKALEKDPQKRYQDANEMLAAAMDSAALADGMNAFDVSTLSQISRHEPSPDELTRTAGTPVPPVAAPVLDVRDVQAEGGVLPPRLQRRYEQLSRKLEERGAKLQRKLGMSPTGARQPRRDVPQVSSSQRVAQTLVLLAVAGGLSIVLGLVFGRHNELEATIISFLFIVGGTCGPLVAHLWFLQRSLTRSTLIDRMTYAAMAGLAMFPAYTLADGPIKALSVLILAPLAAMFICNWGQRIDAGRLGKVDGWSAFWPAVVGLLAMGFADADKSVVLLGGAINTAIALLTPAAASMFPVRASQMRRPPDAAARLGMGGMAISSLPPESAGAEVAVPERAGTPLWTDGASGWKAGTSSFEMAPAPAGAAKEASPPALQSDGALAASPRQAGPPEDVRAEPSFVGRTANAGLALMGKLLLLIGLTLTLVAGPAREVAMTAIESGGLRVDSDIRQLVRDGVSPLAALAPLVLGTFILVWSRRQYSAAHQVRGVLGCLALAYVAVALLIFAGRPFGTLLISRDWGALPWSQKDFGQPLVFTLPILVVGVLLLMWPRARQVRRHRQIVL